MVEIRQPATRSVSLFRDLIAVLRDHVEEQGKQTAILEWIARLQELDREDWGFDGSEDLETGTEGSEEEEEVEEADGADEAEGNKKTEKVDKGKGKERVEDGNADGRKDGDGNGNRNGNREAGGSGNREAGGETLQ